MVRRKLRKRKLLNEHHNEPRKKIHVGSQSEFNNSRPIIGILSQEMSYHLTKFYPESTYHSYIAASYVKFVEASGARVVPIWIGKPESYYKDVLSKVNGVIFPGGNTYYNQSNGYADAGEHIYKIAKKMNREGDHFPILGICLGFELLTYLEANRLDHREDCSSHKQSIPLQFKKGYRQSRLYKGIPKDVLNILKTENVTANSHRYCITESGLKKAKVLEAFNILSVNKDWNGFEFISSLEHVTYPIYGVQFHPEKNIYEFVKNHDLPHSYNAVKVARYFADFFVNQARRNTHRYSDPKEEEDSLIYNYDVYYTGPTKSVFMQCYLFKH